jgi:hypothetical protein
MLDLVFILAKIDPIVRWKILKETKLNDHQR